MPFHSYESILHSMPDRSTTLAPDFLDRYLPYLLRKADQTLSESFYAVLAQAGVARSEWRLLSVLEDLGDLRVADLAVAALSPQPTVTHALRRLEDRGLIAEPHSDVGDVSAGGKNEVGRRVVSEPIDDAIGCLGRAEGAGRWVGDASTEVRLARPVIPQDHIDIVNTITANSAEKSERSWSGGRLERLLGCIFVGISVCLLFISLTIARWNCGAGGRRRGWWSAR